MASPSWISGILGLTTLLSGNGQTTQRRQTLKVTGLSVFDDGVQSVLGGVQTITGSGTWDTKSNKLQIKGSGARVIVVSNPDPSVAHEGFELLITDFAGNGLTNGISFIGSGTITSISQNSGYRRLQWRATNNWQDVT